MLRQAKKHTKNLQPKEIAKSTGNGKLLPAVPALQRKTGDTVSAQRALVVQLQTGEEEETVQGKFMLPVQKKEAVTGDTNRFSPIQKKANNTGLPDNLKSGVENLSGYSMDDVKVHYNSDKPSELQAHAYAKGTDIHLAPGQEKHLPHEAWHVAQQKQGRVQATTQLKGNVPVNDDAGLEQEADVMGVKAMTAMPARTDLAAAPIQAFKAPVQRRFNPNGADFDNIHEYSLDGFLTHNNIPNYLFTGDQHRDLTKDYRQMRVDARGHANDQDELDKVHDDFVEKAGEEADLFKPLSWKVGDVSRSTRYEIPLTWEGRHGARYNKMLHCSFRHVFWNYFVENYQSKALNTMIDDEDTFRQVFKAYADALPTAFEHTDRRTLNAGAANGGLGAGAVNFNVDMGLSADAAEIHSFPVATGNIAVTFDTATHAALKDVMAVYFARKATSPGILAAWNLVKTNPNVVNMYGAELITTFTEIVTPH